VWFLFGCISDDWHSMLDRVYPNVECIVEDIDDIANMFENSLEGGSFADELD